MENIRNQLDIVFRQFMFFSKFFSKSWGPPEIFKTLRNYHLDYSKKGNVIELIERKLPQMVIENEVNKDGVRIVEGWFVNPLKHIAPVLYPSDTVSRATWRGYFTSNSLRVNGCGKKNALVIHLSATGDHGYERRYYGLVKPLLSMGVSSILLTNPFYGNRKPQEQFHSCLQNVSDLFVMGGSLIIECYFLLRWAKEQGFWPLGLSGVSMGGAMASLAATNFLENPIALAAFLSWSSAAPVFTDGALANSIEWNKLNEELKNCIALRCMLRDCGWIDQMEDRGEGYKMLNFPSPAHRLMWTLMEEFTNLVNYPVPVDTKAAQFVIAEQDAYVPRINVPDMEKIWPGATVKLIRNAGHVQGYIEGHRIGIFKNSINHSLGLVNEQHHYQSSITIKQQL